MVHNKLPVFHIFQRVSKPFQVFFILIHMFSFLGFTVNIFTAYLEISPTVSTKCIKPATESFCNKQYYVLWI